MVVRRTVITRIIVFSSYMFSSLLYIHSNTINANACTGNQLPRMVAGLSQGFEDAHKKPNSTAAWSDYYGYNVHGIQDEDLQVVVESCGLWHLDMS